MTSAEFARLLSDAKLVGGDYYAGYQRGLRRRFHGEAFGSAAEHEKWMRIGLVDGLGMSSKQAVYEHSRAELGRGYRDGFEGRAPCHP